MKPRLPTFDKYIDYLREIDASQIYSNSGPLVSRLEERYAKQLGVSNPAQVVACANATLGMQGYLQLSSIPKWHLQSFTFPATVHAALLSGKELVLEDIERDSWMTSPSVVTEQNLEGLVTVLPFGASFRIERFSHTKNLLIDAAASIGSADEWIGKIKEDWAVVFSLHATKCFGIGEGGLVVFGSPSKAEKFRSWLNFGFDGGRVARNIGTNAKLSEIQAAVGLAVLDSWEVEKNDWISSRKLIRRIGEKSGLRLTPPPLRGSELVSPYWIIHHENPEVTLRIESRLNSMAIGTRRWWAKGVHHMPAFTKVPRASTATVDQVGECYLGLPFYRDMSDSLVVTISEILDDCIRESSF